MAKKKKINSKKKGNNYEYKVANWLTNLTGSVFKRTPLSGGMNLDYPFDIRARKPQETVFDKVGVEAKDCTTIKITEWIRQCEEAIKKIDYYYWFIIFHLSGTSKEYVVLPKGYFESLIMQAKLLREVTKNIKRG